MAITDGVNFLLGDKSMIPLKAEEGDVEAALLKVEIGDSGKEVAGVKLKGWRLQCFNPGMNPRRARNRQTLPRSEEKYSVSSLRG